MTDLLTVDGDVVCAYVEESDLLHPLTERSLESVEGEEFHVSVCGKVKVFDLEARTTFELSAEAFESPDAVCKHCLTRADLPPPDP